MHPLNQTLPLLALSILVLSPSPVLPGTDDDLELRVRHAVRDAMQAEGIPGVSVAIDIGSELLLSEGFGESDPADGIRATGSSSYNAGALTEAFLTTAILQLVGEGELALDDPVSKHMPEFQPEEEVTLRQLLGHTSGLTPYGDYVAGQRARGEKPTWKDVVTWIAASPFDADPGTCHQPSDSNTLLLGLLLERMTGTPVPFAVTARVFAPAAMNDTIYSETGPPLEENGDVSREIGSELVILDTGPQPFSSARLCSTALDLVAWQRGLVERTLLDNEGYELLEKELHLEDGEPIGCTSAFDITKLNDIEGRTVGGGVAGGRVHVAYYPDTDLTIAILANTADARVDLLERRLARIVLDLPEPEVRDVFLKPADQVPFAGSYYVGCSEYRVAAGGDHLVLHPPFGASHELLFQGLRLFVSVEDPDVRLEFLMTDGRAEAFYLEERGSRTLATRM